jgi:hypothetical protein
LYVLGDRPGCQDADAKPVPNPLNDRLGKPYLHPIPRLYMGDTEKLITLMPPFGRRIVGDVRLVHEVLRLKIASPC